MEKTVAIAICLFALFAGLADAKEKALEPAPEGKAVVYIGRLTGFVARARPFHFFHNEQYLARVKGKNYIRFVCDPGENLFWVAADSRSFAKADLEAGKSYALFARYKPVAGTMKPGIVLIPVVEGSKAWKEFRGMIGGSKPEKKNEKHIEKWNRKHPDYIRKALDEWKANGEPAVTLRADEFIE